MFRLLLPWLQDLLLNANQHKKLVNQNHQMSVKYSSNPPKSNEHKTMNDGVSNFCIKKKDKQRTPFHEILNLDLLHKLQERNHHILKSAMVNLILVAMMSNKSHTKIQKINWSFPKKMKTL